MSASRPGLLGAEEPPPDTRPGEISTAEAKRIAAVMGDMEQRRREAEGADMRQDVHIERLYIPASTKAACLALVAVIAAMIGWNLIETIANGKQQRDDKREVWIEMGRQQSRIDVQDVRLSTAESRLNKLEDRK